ncbi:alpha/beta hydrolase [Rhodoferax sp.]|uniref:alpha/beta hydrolase n=1 Tax=Rhodoferax sp. TaxID=50421 RepID=UPI00374D2326
MKSFLSAVALALATLAGSALAADVPSVKAKNVVLVHGAWADGSSWADVIPYLRAAGLHVTSVQNPLTSLDDDAAAVRRALALQDGPTVLVAHSYGGSVISEVGGEPKVSALVYVAARAPDAGEDFGALASKFPTMPVRAGLQEHDGFVMVSEDAFLNYFADGVPTEKAKSLFSVQQPIAKNLFTGKTTTAAWKLKPSWYVVSQKDNTTSPDLQRYLAARMKAHTIEVESGHLSLVSHPQEIAKAILAATQQ